MKSWRLDNIITDIFCKKKTTQHDLRKLTYLHLITQIDYLSQSEITTHWQVHTEHCKHRYYTSKKLHDEYWSLCYAVLDQNVIFLLFDQTYQIDL